MRPLSILPSNLPRPNPHVVPFVPYTSFPLYYSSFSKHLDDTTSNPLSNFSLLSLTSHYFLSPTVLPLLHPLVDPLHPRCPHNTALNLSLDHHRPAAPPARKSLPPPPPPFPLPPCSPRGLAYRPKCNCYLLSLVGYIYVHFVQFHAFPDLYATRIE